MRILVVQNYHNTGLGQVGTALAEVGAEIDTRLAHEGAALPGDAASHDALVVLGGAQNALDDAAYPYMPSLVELIRDFERRDKAVLGICLGSQLLARAFGGRNLIGTAPEFGWQDVSLTDDGRTDTVLGGLPGDFPIFQWHDDTFTLPAGAVRLAGNGAAENQAFRFGRAAYGIQFHFEADRGLVRAWSAAFSGWLAEHQPGWAERIDLEAERHGAAADAAGLHIAGAWVGIV